MNRSQSAAAAAIARAESMPRPHTAAVAIYLYETRLQLSSYGNRAHVYGAHWAAAQLRRVTRNLANAIDAADATV